MAHVITIVYGSTGASSISLALASGTGGAFLGFGSGESGYAAGTPAPDVSYNASLYRDGQRPAFSRYGNVIDDLEVTVSEATIDAAIVTVGNIKKALWQARDFFERPSARAPVYLAFLPSGSTNYAYSVIYGGTVDEPVMDEADLLDKRAKLRIRIEREPFWRNAVPTGGVSGTLYGGGGGTAIVADPAGAANAKPWGTLAVSSVGGHIPALTYFAFAPDTGAGLTIDRLVVGYRSELRHPPFTGVATGSFDNEPFEAESGTMGTDCTATADATASPGAGNSRVTCTFATKTSAKRITWDSLSGTAPAPSIVEGKYRAFIRAKCASANTVTAFLKYYRDSAISSPRSTTSVSITATSWTMVDMGVLTFSEYSSSLPYISDVGTGSSIELWASATTTADVYFDLVVLVPCDEYYLSVNGANATAETHIIYASTVEPNGAQYPIVVSAGSYAKPFGDLYSPAAIGTGSLFLPPGNGKLIWISGNSAWVNTYAAASNCILQLLKVQRYLTALGNG